MFYNLRGDMCSRNVVSTSHATPLLMSRRVSGNPSHVRCANELLPRQPHLHYRFSGFSFGDDEGIKGFGVWHAPLGFPVTTKGRASHCPGYSTHTRRPWRSAVQRGPRWWILSGGLEGAAKKEEKVFLSPLSKYTKPTPACAYVSHADPYIRESPLSIPGLRLHCGIIRCL